MFQSKFDSCGQGLTPDRERFSRDSFLVIQGAQEPQENSTGYKETKPKALVRLVKFIIFMFAIIHIAENLIFYLKLL